MKLYHFTAERFVPSILRDGLTRGFVLLDFDTRTMSPHYRWLTTNPAWDQEWAEGTGRLPYKRNEVRLTIDVPLNRIGQVHMWTIAGPLLTAEYSTLSSLGDPDNWRLFRGNVPPQWIIESQRNPLLNHAESYSVGGAL